MANVKELREKIAARKAERAEAQKQKYAKIRLVAEKAPEKLEACLAKLADKCAHMAEGWENLRENLNLVKASKEAPLKVRIATTRNYAKNFKRIAAESPEKMADALAEAYQGLNGIAADIEMAAQQMGIDLEAHEGHVDTGDSGDGAPASFEEEMATDIMEVKEEPPVQEEKPEVEDEEEKEASGADAWVTDRVDGEPKAPVMANAGTDGFMTDRDKSADPKKPAKLETPKSQGQSEVNKASSKVTPAGKKSATGNL